MIHPFVELSHLKNSLQCNVRIHLNIFQAVEVKFTLSEFVTCYKRLMGLNLEGFSEFVNRTLEALISTSMMVHQTMTTDKRNKFCPPVQVPTSLMRSVPKHTPIEAAQQIGQNKTYVRLSVKRPPEKKAFSCYQTLMDVHPSNRAESGKCLLNY